MTTTTRNEAAERLREWMGLPRYTIPGATSLIDQALAAERAAGRAEVIAQALSSGRLDDSPTDVGWRIANDALDGARQEASRATVERIRERLYPDPDLMIRVGDLRTILDAEAAR